MNLAGFARAIRKVYTLKYVVLNLVMLIIYYKIIELIIAAQQFGIDFYVVPISLIYLLAITSSILMTIGIYAMINSKSGSKYGGPVPGTATAIFGGIIGGCGCQGAAFYSILALAVGGGEATLLNTVVAEHISLVFVAMALVNLVLAAYYLNRISGNLSEGKGRRK